MLSHPACCQTSVHTYRCLKAPALPIRLGASKPSALQMAPNTPLPGESSSVIRPTMTTVEMKWGMYVMVWKILRYFPSRIWLMPRANMIGTGKTSSP